MFVRICSVMFFTSFHDREPNGCHFRDPPLWSFRNFCITYLLLFFYNHQAIGRLGSSSATCGKPLTSCCVRRQYGTCVQSRSTATLAFEILCASLLDTGINNLSPHVCVCARVLVVYGRIRISMNMHNYNNVYAWASLCTCFHVKRVVAGDLFITKAASACRKTVKLHSITHPCDAWDDGEFLVSSGSVTNYIFNHIAHWCDEIVV